MERGLVRAAALGIRLSERHVDGAAELLVEERVSGELLHRLVHSEREFAQPTGALVHREHLPEEILAFARA